MKNHPSRKTPSLLLSVLALFASASLAQAENADHAHKVDAPVQGAGKESTWLEKAKAAYPLETCVVSGDKLEVSSMGEPVDYIHQEQGKEDRLVRFCCKSCIKTFKKDPAKYLKLIDEAAAAKAKQAGPAH